MLSKPVQLSPPKPQLSEFAAKFGTTWAQARRRSRSCSNNSSGGGGGGDGCDGGSVGGGGWSSFGTRLGRRLPRRAPLTRLSLITHLFLSFSPQALADGAVYNAADAMDVLGVDEETLAAMWGGAKSKGKETCVSTLT